MLADIRLSDGLPHDGEIWVYKDSILQSRTEYRSGEVVTYEEYNENRDCIFSYSSSINSYIEYSIFDESALKSSYYSYNFGTGYKTKTEYEYDGNGRVSKYIRTRAADNKITVNDTYFEYGEGEAYTLNATTRNIDGEVLGGYVIKYNERERLIYQNENDGEFLEEYKYDENNNLTEYIWTENGAEIRRKIYEYEAADYGTLVRMFYYQKGELFETWENEFDNNGNLLISRVIKPDGTVYIHEKCEYNDDGLLTLHMYYDNSPEATTWTKKTYNGNGDELTVDSFSGFDRWYYKYEYDRSGRLSRTDSYYIGMPEGIENQEPFTFRDYLRYIFRAYFG